MADSGSQTEALLKGPLYVYDLPSKILENLTLKSHAQPIATPPTDTVAATAHSSDRETVIATSNSCTLCQISFQNVQEHRDHARSDHHRYNVKAQLRGNQLLNEAEFTKAIGEIDESISGSESSESDEDEPEPHASDSNLVALLKKQAKISQEESTVPQERNALNKQPIVWFSNPDLPQNTALGVYKAIFSNKEQDNLEHIVDALRRKQLEPIKRVNNTDKASSNQGPHIFMCMIGGGHFAAMIIGLAPEIQKRQGGIEERQARVLAHKTFHRYTTRRKQGGAQSANDAAKGAAHSAGSSLRRYNEAALENDIRTLLKDWQAMIDTAELIFVRATGNTNRKTLFGSYEGQVLRNNDARLRSFPFSTRRATQAELMRCFKELTRVKVSQIDETALAAAQAKPRETSTKPVKPAPQPKAPKLSEEEEAAMLHTSQIQALIRRSKAPALLSYVSNNAIPPSFRFFPADAPQNHHAPTPLHLAANSDSPALVISLLSKAKFDPTMKNSEGKTPFDLARDRATRDAFRVARHELGESAWDWEAAHVPSPISQAEVSQRQEKEREEATKEEADRRKAEIERLKAEEAANVAAVEKRKNVGGRKLASLDKTATEKREDEMRGMTPEMRMRLERERRARAAEERIRRMQGS
ncbi:C2H2 finger and ankyrin domain protein, putative [Talaromyces stipitatus ATCC 10500]|uniref:C2H2 finger and ankyrin domain protein, putative n=1 Tax=Talaromyces stipitatus (strain ATCC 10500 / CBS 375.48 / QM 6759 / NRRL 1006) TaxID=441959 RepID=B8M9Z6_TALSN|nr:C2H2 finger and ankyrin domain protein, putative [Talaromyces stipitatus ATCC 10500]EED18148.1 C2H2 finger and ankyrin domain protein, putative [Talaromyces stipitatus ATCC 10500]